MWPPINPSSFPYPHAAGFCLVTAGVPAWTRQHGFRDPPTRAAAGVYGLACIEGVGAVAGVPSLVGVQVTLYASAGAVRIAYAVTDPGVGESLRLHFVDGVTGIDADPEGFYIAVNNLFV